MAPRRVGSVTIAHLAARYRAPEVLIRTGYNTPCDVWSVACIIFELATGDQLFHPKNGERHSKDGAFARACTRRCANVAADDHVALIVELLGHWPKQFAKGGKRSKELFNGQGRPKAIQRLEMWPLEPMLREKCVAPSWVLWAVFSHARSDTTWSLPRPRHLQTSCCPC